MTCADWMKATESALRLLSSPGKAEPSKPFNEVRVTVSTARNKTHSEPREHQMTQRWSLWGDTVT